MVLWAAALGMVAVGEEAVTQVGATAKSAYARTLEHPLTDHRATARAGLHSRPELRFWLLDVSR